MTVTRRALLGASAIAALAPLAARAQGQAGYGSVAVDVGPLRAKGLGEYADIVRGTLQRELAAAFADRMVRGGPRLVVRIDGVSLRSYVGGGSGRLGGGGMQNDYLEGEALVLGRGGAPVLRHPQLSALPASSGGAWYLPDNEARRLQALCNHYASWLRRDLG